MGVFPVRQYQPGGEFVVVRAMDYGTHHFEAGEPFPWREMGLHEAVVQMLWKAVRIEVQRAPVESAATPAPAAVGPSSPMEPSSPSSPMPPAAEQTAAHEHTAPSMSGEGESTAALEHAAAPAVAPPAQLDLGVPSSSAKPAGPSKPGKSSTNPLLGKPLLAKR